MHLAPRHGMSDVRGRKAGLERASGERKKFVSKVRDWMIDMQQRWSNLFQAVFLGIPGMCCG